MFARFVRHCAVALLFANAAVAATPAFRLGNDASPRRYDVRLAIDPRATDFEGDATIELTVNEATDTLWLNAAALEIHKASFTQGERDIPVSIAPGGEDFIGLRSTKPFAIGPATVHFAYRGKLDALAVEGLFRQEERGDWYALSQFEALGARRAFPCFDEPAWKTPWRLTVDAPGSNVVVANTPETSATEIADRPGWWRHEFSETKPLASYLVALAVGPFDVVEGGTAGRNHTPLRYVTPRGRGAEARYAAAVTPKLLELLEEYFDMPYPFEKLDSVAIPQLVTFDAMENVGLITYASQLLLARAHEETPRFRELYASIAAHEIAHMWFGNFVTLAWWDDTWLNEAFASWVGSKVQHAMEPSWDNGVRTRKSRSGALAADRLASARSIAAPIESRNAIDDAFDDITYNKGEEVLAMFEAWIGPERFRKAVRSFLLQHPYGTATSADFFDAVGEAAGNPGLVLRAFKGFVNQSGAPLVDLQLDCEGKPTLVVSQDRFRPTGSKMRAAEWTTPACFRYRAGSKDFTQCEDIGSKPLRIPLRDAPACPSWVVGNAGGRGHYLVRYAPALLQRIAERAGSLPQHEMQALARDTLLLYESGLVPVESAFMVADSALNHASPNVAAAGVDLLAGLRDEWLTPPQEKEKARVVEQRVIPIARELGWTSREGDSDDTRALRAVIMRFAADRFQGADLRAEARALALRWLADNASVDATMAQSALDVAGRFADEATFEKLEAAIVSTESTRDRFLMLGAIARVRAPALRKRMLELSLASAGGKPRIEGRSAFSLLDKALRDDRNRGAAMDYVLSNLDALEAKLPKDTPAALMVPMGRACTGFQRDALAMSFENRAARYMTGPLRYAQALESIDLCIAARESSAPPPRTPARAAADSPAPRAAPRR